MDSFFLHLNAAKTKILVVIPSALINKILIQGTFINGLSVRFVESAKNLAVIIDKELDFKEHIIRFVQMCNGIIRQSSKISFEELQTSVSALIFSPLDYCNISLFYGIKKELIDKLPSVQNSVARLIKGKKGGKCLTSEFMRQCHWSRRTLCIQDLFDGA